MGRVSDTESVIILVDCGSETRASDIEEWFQHRGRTTFRTSDLIQAISLAIHEFREYEPDVVVLETNRPQLDLKLVTELSGMFSCQRPVRVCMLPTLSKTEDDAMKPVEWLTVAFD